MKYHHIICFVLAMLCINISSAKSQENTRKEIIITGTLSDSLLQNMKGIPEIEIKNGEEYFPFNKYAVTFTGNSFKFKFTPESDIQYFRLYFAPTILLLRSYLILPGDSVHIDMLGIDNIKFQSNSKLFESQYKVKEILEKISYKKNISLIPQYNAYLKEINNTLLHYKPLLSQSIYEILRINAQNQVSSSFCKALTTPIAVSNENEKYLKEFAKFMASRPLPTTEFLLRNLDRNTDALLDIEKFKNTLSIWNASYSIPDFKSNRFDLVRQSIKSNYKGLLKNQLLTTFYFELKRDSKNSLRDLDEDIPTIKDNICLNKLIKIKQGAMNGNPAFPFNLENEDGTHYSLEDFKEKVVVAIFYSTGCGPCADLHAFLSEWKKPLYKNNNIVFLNISTDRYREKWLADLKLGIYTSPKEINLWLGEKNVGHPMFGFYNYIGVPQMLLIDKKGKIISSNPVRPIDSNTLIAFDKLIKSYM